MQRPHPIKFPLKITEDCDPDCHAVVGDANDAVVIRLLVGDLEMLNVIVRELNARAANQPNMSRWRQANPRSTEHRTGRAGCVKDQ
jgi:hypothetical protein